MSIANRPPKLGPGSGPTGGSLDRFLLKRGPTLLGLSGGKAASWINFGVAGLLCGIAGTMAIIAGVTHDPGILAGTSGPLAGAVANIAVGIRMRRMLARTEATDVKLSTEARTILAKWMRQAFGWGYRMLGSNEALGNRIAERKMARRAALFGTGPTQHTADSFLAPELFAVMESLSKHFNRIQGVVTALKEQRAPSVVKIRQSLALAADETMADALHQAALYDAYPESGGAYLESLQASTAALSEVADRAESLQRRFLSEQKETNTATALEAALEELKLDELAHRELVVEEDRPQDQELQH